MLHHRWMALDTFSRHYDTILFSCLRWVNPKTNVEEPNSEFRAYFTLGLELPLICEIIRLKLNQSTFWSFLWKFNSCMRKFEMERRFYLDKFYCVKNFEISKFSTCIQDQNSALQWFIILIVTFFSSLFSSDFKVNATDMGCCKK